MSKLYIQNLSILVTQKCNFACRHCMRGSSKNVVVDDNTLVNLFNQVDVVGNLCFCGGEPLMCLDRIKKIFEVVQEKNVIIGQYGGITNGTFYTEEVENVFDDFDNYVKSCQLYFRGPTFNNNKNYGYLNLSWDIYHQEQLFQLKQNNVSLYYEYLENIKKLLKSKYYVGSIDVPKRLFNEGNAINLDLKKSELKKWQSYLYQDDDFMICGPIVSISCDGMITECNGSYENLKENFNYGNINKDDLREVMSKESIHSKTLKKFYKNVEKENKRYLTYK